METITIRQATSADYDAISPLFVQVDQLHTHAVPDLFQASDAPARTRKWFIQMTTSEDTVLFVAECHGEIAGLVLCAVYSSPDFPLFVPRRIVQINELVVREAFQRQGIGRCLMQRAHEWARTQGATDVELTVYEFNTTARQLYEDLGYQTLRRVLRYHQPEPERS
jgi:ribosomal protein S18 acetylase RimI-like enzyme